MVESDITL